MTESRPAADHAISVDALAGDSAHVDAPQQQLDDTLPRPQRVLGAADFGHRRRRKALPLILFVATCASTFWAGATDWLKAFESGELPTVFDWRQGAVYMFAVIGILLAHEMGHFLQTLRYRVPASYPYFIPVPLLMTGTMGAVIAMDGSKADRKQLFDIGICGPWAGLIVALPIIWFGIQTATAAPPSDFVLGDPLLFRLMASYLRPDLPSDIVLNKSNPLLMAGWVGMLITSLNMLPVSQLDGGHVIYGMFGRRAHLLARGFVITAILLVVLAEYYTWTLMLVLIILLGVDHPPTADDSVPIGPIRYALGLMSLSLPVLCFTPISL